MAPGKKDARARRSSRSSAKATATRRLGEICRPRLPGRCDRAKRPSNCGHFDRENDGVCVEPMDFPGVSNVFPGILRETHIASRQLPFGIQTSPADVLPEDRGLPRSL